MTHSKQRQPLFRPYLTKEEITLISALLDTGEFSELEEHESLRRKIKELMYKISEGIITPSHIREKKTSIEDILGVSDSRESRKKFLYENYMSQVSSNSLIQLTKEEIDLIEEYRYENNLMTTKEEEKYVASIAS